jgi:EmrB/QacA subfamily drug resistance transporter
VSGRAQAGTAAPVFESSLCAARDRRWLLTAAILASALGFIDGSVVAIALPAMRETLGASLLQAQWITNAYLLTLSGLVLVGGALADRLGLARVFGAGIALFVGASMACALAPGPATLIAARALQGLGAAAMIPGSLAMIARAYPPAQRGRAIGLWSAASALTTALGPAAGGALLATFGPEAWRLIFAINLPLGGVALWLIWRFTRRSPNHAGRPVDLPGAALATGGLLLLAWGLSGSEPGGAIRWPLAAVGLGVFAGFIVSQAVAPAPMMPLQLFRNRIFAAANALSFCLYFSLTAMLFYLPMTVIAGWGVSPFAASLAFVPLSAFIFALSAPMGRLADRIGPRLPITLGSLTVALAYALVALTAPAQAFFAMTLPGMALAGLGMAGVVAPLSVAVMGSVAPHEAGTASGINNAVTRVAGLMAVALMGALASLVYAAAGGTLSFAETGGDAVHAAATNAAFRVLAGTCAAFSTLSAAIAWLGIQASSSASQ